MKAISISLVSALAIAASPAALAQVETADLVIPQDQVERVQAYCEELVASGASQSDAPAEGVTEDETTTPDDAAAAAEAPAEEGEINWQEIDDLADVVDLDTCVEAGFVDASAAVEEGGAEAEVPAEAPAPQ